MCNPCDWSDIMWNIILFVGGNDGSCDVRCALYGVRCCCLYAQVSFSLILPLKNN